MIQPVTKDITTDLAVTLLDGSEAPVAGLTSVDVTVRYRKNGAASFTTKALLPGEFNEIGDGIYLITFDSSELDTGGNFRIIVTGGGFEKWVGDVVVINDQLSLRDQLVSLKAAYATLANTRDVDVLFAQLELRQKNLEKTARDLTKRAEVLRSQIAATRKTS